MKGFIHIVLLFILLLFQNCAKNADISIDVLDSLPTEKQLTNEGIDIPEDTNVGHINETPEADQGSICDAQENDFVAKIVGSQTIKNENLPSSFSQFIIKGDSTDGNDQALFMVKGKVFKEHDTKICNLVVKSMTTRTCSRIQLENATIQKIWVPLKDNENGVPQSIRDSCSHLGAELIGFRPGS